MYPRAKYKPSEQTNWSDIPDHVATKKWDGASFFMQIDGDGSARFFSRRPSVKGGYPERTAQLPHLTQKTFPHLAGNVYTVELVHTGHDHTAKESHGKLSGILNSLPPRSIETQRQDGPVRAVLIDTINPALPTYKDKLLHMKEVERHFGDPKLMFVPQPHTSKEAIVKLIENTAKRGEEGVIITSLSLPEEKNIRVKQKNFGTFNLRITKVLQEFDKHGMPKQSMGAVTVADSTGREVADVGSGFSKADREDAFLHPSKWIGRLIQVKTMGLGSVGGRLRHPVYNGDADGSIDTV